MTTFLMEPVDLQKVAEARRFDSSEAWKAQRDNVNDIYKKMVDNPDDVTLQEVDSAFWMEHDLIAKDRRLMNFDFIVSLVKSLRG